MEKQLLYLLDYDLGITEDEIVDNFQPFLSQYTFDSPCASTSSPILPPSPVTPVRVPSQCGARRHRRVASRGSDTFIAPPLDRSGSSSSLESEDMPLTPSQSSPPSPRRPENTKGKSNRSTSAVHIQRPAPVYDAPTSGSYSLPRSVTGVSLAKAAVEPMPSKEGFMARFLRSDRRRRPSTRLEEEEEAVAALSWTAM